MGESYQRVQGLDAIRGFAITLVMLRHSWPEVFGGAGIVGVIAFFTLSGYLITGLLISDVERYRKVRWGRFYRNRAFRLVPALALLLGGFVVAEGLINISGMRDDVARAVVVAITYTMDIPGFSHGDFHLSHLWTLANEEQFYLIWPLILVFGIRHDRVRLAVAISAGALLAILWLSIGLTYPGSLGLLYSLPSTWTIALVIGAAAQLGKARISGVVRGRVSSCLALAATIVMLALSMVPDLKSNVLFYAGGGIAVALLTLMLIWKLREVPRVPAFALPLVWLGIVSYAAYLWNMPIGAWLRDGGFGRGWQFAAIGLTLIAAVVSWFAIEAPFNRLRARLEAQTSNASERTTSTDYRRVV